jgi:hypothetical protein
MTLSQVEIPFYPVWGKASGDGVEVELIGKGIEKNSFEE